MKNTNDVSKVSVNFAVEPNYAHFACPECGQHYKMAKVPMEGMKLACQKCGAVFELTEKDIPFVRQETKTPEPAPQQRQKNPNVDFSERIIEGNIRCPHCWKTFSEGDVLYISMHPDLFGDSLLGPDHRKRFTPVVYNSQGIPLDEREMPCTEIACPHCHLQVPLSVLDMESVYISIVGAPSSGKSYYLTALVHQLRKTLPEYAECSFADVDPRLNRTLNIYENQLFMPADRSKVVSLAKTEEVGMDFSDQTMLNGLPVFLPKPFMFQAMPLSNTEGANSGRCKNIIFYDNAGEHFEPGHEKVTNPATLHLVHSNAIFFIFDPLNDSDMRQVCNQSDPQIDDISKVSNQTILFSEMVSRIRRHSNMTMQQKSSIPLILAIAKYDVWEHLFNLNIRELSPFKFNPETLEMEFDADVLYEVSFALREFMLQYVPGIVAQAETFFENVLFVPFSSFGSLAEAAEASEGKRAVGIVPSKLNPVWVDIPFFAAMNHYNALPWKKQEQKDVLPLEVKKTEDKLLFAHPETKRRVHLPMNYAGHRIRIGGKLYQIPEFAKQQTQPEINTDYWS